MDINKRSRTELKSYFVKNSIPTEGNFADLIDGMLNQKDDGIVKLPGEPLSLVATGDQTSLKKVINFYDDFVSTKPTWTLSLRTGKPDANKPGWNLSDGDGNSRLFIDSHTGYVGVGTVTPQAKLDVAGVVQIGGSGQKEISFSRDAADHENAGKIAYKADWSKTSLSIVGAGRVNDKETRKITLYDDVKVDHDLTVGRSLRAEHIAVGETSEGRPCLSVGLNLAKIDGSLIVHGTLVHKYAAFFSEEQPPRLREERPRPVEDFYWQFISESLQHEPVGTMVQALQYPVELKNDVPVSKPHVVLWIGFKPNSNRAWVGRIRINDNDLDALS